MTNQEYHTPDAALNAQRMLEDLDKIHYGICRLYHDHKEGDFTFQDMSRASHRVAEAAKSLMQRFPTIKSPTFNRDWFDLVTQED